MTLAEQLQMLTDQFNQGILDRDEFERAKALAISGRPEPAPTGGGDGGCYEDEIPPAGVTYAGLKQLAAIQPVLAEGFGRVIDATTSMANSIMSGMEKVGDAAGPSCTICGWCGGKHHPRCRHYTGI